MVQLASSLGLTPIAEVVESQATADALEEMGCHFGQGNFFCAPVEAEDALQCLAAEHGGVLPPGEFEEGRLADSDPAGGNDHGGGYGGVRQRLSPPFYSSTTRGK